MEESHNQMEPPPPPPPPLPARPHPPQHMETLTSFAGELTRWNSDASSLSLEYSGDVFRLHANASPCSCTEWTYEKHNQYLNHLEASFVEQLHQSMNFFGGCSGQARNLPMEQTINFVKTTAVGSRPCIEHAGGPYYTGSLDVPECCSIQQEENVLRERKMFSHRLAGDFEHLPGNYVYHSGFVGSIAEGSGQNFVDGDCEDYSTSETKKLKTEL